MLKIKKMATTPIKRNQHIVQLSKDHHFTLLFCWKIRQGIKMQIESERQKNYIRYFFKEHMEPNFQNEEKLLFNQASIDKSPELFSFGDCKTFSIWFLISL